MLFKIRILNILFILSEIRVIPVQVFCRGCRVCCEILGSTPVSGVGEGVPPPSRTSHKKFRRRDTQRPTRGTRMRPNPRRAPRRTHYIHSTFLSSFDIRISSFDSSVLFAVNHTKKEAPGGVTLPVAVFSSEQLELSLAYFKPNLNRPYYGASPCLRRSSRSSRQSAPVLEDVTGHRPARATQR